MRQRPAYSGKRSVTVSRLTIGSEASDWMLTLKPVLWHAHRECIYRQGSTQTDKTIDFGKLYESYHMSGHFPEVS